MTLASTPLAVAVGIFVTSTLITTVIAPVVRRLGLRHGFTDTPDARKQHNVPMVRLGGIAMVLGFVLRLVSPGFLAGSGC